jgi:hypothetical protein
MSTRQRALLIQDTWALHTYLVLCYYTSKVQTSLLTALRNLGVKTLETLAELLMPPSSDATRLLSGDLESNDSKRRLGVIVAAILPRPPSAAVH